MRSAWAEGMISECRIRRSLNGISNPTTIGTPRICMHGSDACQLSAYASEAEVKVCKCSGGGGESHRKTGTRLKTKISNCVEMGVQ